MEKEFNINEAFKELDMVETKLIYEDLDENSFDLEDADDIASLSRFLRPDEDVEKDDIQMIVDYEAESDQEAKENDHTGDLILQCPVCTTMHFIKRENIQNAPEDETDPDAIWDADVECEKCGSTGGFELVGKVAPFVPEEEPVDDNIDGNEETEDIPEQELDDAVANEVEQEVEEDKKDTATIGESLIESKEVTLDIKDNKLVGYLTIDKSITIPGNVKEIAKEVFKGCTSIEEVIIEEGVEKIDNYAFEGCTNLKSVKLPKSVTWLGHKSFGGCDNVKIVTPKHKISVYVPDMQFFKDHMVFEDGSSVSESLIESKTDKIYAKLDDASREDLERKLLVYEDDLSQKALARMTDDDIKALLYTYLTDDPEAEWFNGEKITEEKCPECGKEIDKDHPMCADCKAKEEAKEEDKVIEDINEEMFDDLANKYLHSIYENVESYKTTDGAIDDETNSIIIEGVIKFKSGKEDKTKFIFEADTITKRGKVRLYGLNETFSNAKKAFSLKCGIKGTCLLPEALTYNYNAKSLTESKKIYGRVATKLVEAADCAEDVDTEKTDVTYSDDMSIKTKSFDNKEKAKKFVAGAKKDGLEADIVESLINEEDADPWNPEKVKEASCKDGECKEENCEGKDCNKEVVKEALTERFEEYMLVDKDGKEVVAGSELVDFRGDKAKFVEITKAPIAPSSGKIVVIPEGSDWEREFYPGVFDCEIVERDSIKEACKEELNEDIEITSFEQAQKECPGCNIGKKKDYFDFYKKEGTKIFKTEDGFRVEYKDGREDKFDKDGKLIKEEIEEAITHVDVTTDDGNKTGIDTESDKVELEDEGDKLEIEVEKAGGEDIPTEMIAEPFAGEDEIVDFEDAANEIDSEFAPKDEVPMDDEAPVVDTEDEDALEGDEEIVDAEDEIEDAFKAEEEEEEK